MRRRGTVLIHCTSPHQYIYTSEVSSRYLLYFCVMLCTIYFCKFSETTKPTEAFHVTPPRERGKDGKLIQNNLRHLLIVIIVNQGAGAFSRDFTTNLAPQCRAFSRALKIEK